MKKTVIRVVAALTLLALQSGVAMASDKDLEDANYFCGEAATIYTEIEKSFDKFQAGTTASKNKNNVSILKSAVAKFSVRSAELEEDAADLLAPNLKNQDAVTAMAEMIVAVRGVARSNAEASDNLIAFLSDAQSPERSMENSKRIGATRTFLSMKYVMATVKLFEAYGLTANDIDDKTMCLSDKPKSSH